MRNFQNMNVTVSKQINFQFDQLLEQQQAVI